MGGPDTPENPQSQVCQNRDALKQALGLENAAWAIPEQVHGHRVGRAGDAQLCQTDALLVLAPNQPAMVLTADCVPILLYDPQHHVGALVHAGWRGTAQTIVKEAVLALQNAAGSQPEEIVAVIGPAIGPCCFQVSQDVLDQLLLGTDDSQTHWERQNWVQWDEAYPQNPRVDLKNLNAHQLSQMGITQIETTPDCTYCQNDRWYSFRHGDTGRNGAVLALY